MTSKGILFLRDLMTRSFIVKSPAAKYSCKIGSTNQLRMNTDQ